MTTSSGELSTGGAKEKVNQKESPYILHPSDHLGLVFVIIPFTGKNFASWKNSMETALYAKHKGRFIDGSLPLPELTSSDLNRWKKNDVMFKAWIRNSLAKDIHESVTYAEMTREIWLELYERCRQSNAPRVYKIKKEFSNLIQDDNQSLTQYYTKFKTLCKNYKFVIYCLIVSVRLQGNISKGEKE